MCKHAYDSKTVRSQVTLSCIRVLTHACCCCVDPSAALQTEKFYDMLGTGSFAALAVGSLLAAKSMHARKVSSKQQQQH
jgi:hypothetical protein